MLLSYSDYKLQQILYYPYYFIQYKVARDLAMYCIFKFYYYLKSAVKFQAEIIAVYIRKNTSGCFASHAHKIQVTKRTTFD